ncbi:MAG TPA: hypothetical protein VF976_03075 [Gemmatimonadales bacterium]
MTLRHRSAVALLLLTLVVAVGAVLAVTQRGDLAQYLAPSLASIGVLVGFSLLLWRQVGSDIFGELGSLYVGFIVAYTVVPAFAFVVTGLDEGGPLAQLLPEASELGKHLWRHVLFETGVAGGYLLLRGRRTVPGLIIASGTERDDRTLLVAVVVIAVSLASTTLLSAPVSNYYEHYVRYDHLPWLLHKFVSLCIRFSLGLYCLLLVFLFRNYQKYKLIIPVVVAAICTYEISYSYGARIQSLIVLLMAMCLYHFTVRKVSLKMAFVAGVGMTALFTVVEVMRLLQFDWTSAPSAVAEAGSKPAGEFLSVFYSGFHLYTERAQGTLPAREWPMFFTDIISLFTFGSFTRWNPMDWYTRNYVPDADVAPFTLGPIADSAMWGGEADLVARAVVNGLFFAFLMRWFLHHKDRWWGLSVYVYCYATCILTLKYTVFLHLNLIEKNLVPVLLLVQAARTLRFSKSAIADGRVSVSAVPASDVDPAAVAQR